MKIILNGEEKLFDDGLSLDAVIQRLGVRRETVVAEVNRKIVKNEDRPQCRLQDGDQVELIQFVGGG
ncbi:MAG TPA: sulfur carrier protein ThiS [bacterium]|nr:sulfur carrier protein ThiS [bacterium]